MRSVFAGRRLEMWGIGVGLLGVLLALASYLHVAGAVGRTFDDGFAVLCGSARYLLPIGLLWAAYILVKKGQELHFVRLLIGWIFITASILGLFHIAHSIDQWGDSTQRRRAGGVLGMAIGAPLRAYMSPVGGGAVLVALLIVGILLATGLTAREFFSRVFHYTRRAAQPVGKAARQKWEELSSLTSERAGMEEGEEWEAQADAARELDARYFDTRPPAGRSGPTPVVYDGEADLAYNFTIYDDEEYSSRIGVVDDEAEDGALVDDHRGDSPGTRKRTRKPVIPGRDDVPPGRQDPLDLGPASRAGKWKLPAASVLSRSVNQSINHAEVEQRGRTLEEALAAHGVEVTLVGQTVGPTVTRYELELGPGVKVARVTSLQRDIAYAMAATDVRILAPIPGRSAIGVEVPNHTRQLVSLGDLFAAAEAKAATHPLDVAIGKDIAGRAVFLNLATTPHLLIAGATGAGKSSGINCIITSLLMRTTPDQVRLILVDPKQVEMGQYAKSPHLLTAPVTNPKKAANALAWAVKEMDVRYDLLFEVGYRDITGYNAAYDRGELVPEPGSDKQYERLPYIVVVVDELNDLMMVAARDVEDSIIRIAQKARAVGIHLILATQRPSANVITGVIKANIPARMAFAVSSLVDSRVILDQPGAEKLVGKGDMLLLPGNSNVAARIQGAWVAEEEVRAVVAHWKRQAPEVVYVSGVEGDEGAGGSGGPGNYSAGDDDDDDALLEQAMDLVVRSKLGSTSMLQRKLKVGFARAGRLMDLLEQKGVVGPSEGSKAREVLMTVEELELLQERKRNGR